MKFWVMSFVDYVFDFEYVCVGWCCVYCVILVVGCMGGVMFWCVSVIVLCSMLVLLIWFVSNRISFVLMSWLLVLDRL